MIYTPPNVLIELEGIMEGEGINRRTEAFNVMLKRAKIGKVVESIARDPLGLRKVKKTKKNKGGLL